MGKGTLGAEDLYYGSVGSSLVCLQQSEKEVVGR